MIKVLICGASGRMSKRIASLILDEADMTIVAATEKKGHPGINKPLKEVIGLNEADFDCKVSDDIGSVIKEADVIIDFTAPDASILNLKAAAENSTAAVIGTTGFSQAQLKEIEKISAAIAVFLSPNMSLGVNTVFKVLKDLSRLLPADYNVEIVETHHRHKKDAPSGTAKKLAEIIAEARGLDADKDIIYGRQGATGERPDNQIAVHALRGGSVCGRHEIRFISDDDEITLIHNAASRDIFARGAIRAARFIAGKEPGLYSFRDIM